MNGEADLPPVEPVELERQFLLRFFLFKAGRLGLGVRGLFFLRFLLFVLGFLLRFLQQSEFGLGEEEPVVRLPGEKHPVDIVGHGIAVRVCQALPGRAVVHHRPVQAPADADVVEAAPGQVDDPAPAVARDEADLGGEEADDAELDQKPLPVRAPAVALVAVGVGVIVRSRQNQPALLGRQVDDLQGGPVFQVSDFLAVRGEFGLKLLGRRGRDRFLLEERRGEEIGLLLADDRGRVDVPVVVSFGGVDECPAVRAEAHHPLLLGGVGHALGRPAFGADDENLAPEDKGDFFAVGG